ncbi:hypothetical protein K2Z84_06330, partial [Candidatus Binatia bacterium]|nr:hypothetical protein [Candidatus Binatia bacterium]
RAAAERRATSRRGGRASRDLKDARAAVDLLARTLDVHHAGEDYAHAAAMAPLALEVDDPRLLTTPLFNALVDRFALRAATAGIVVAVGLIAGVVLREAILGRLGTAAHGRAELSVYLSVIDALLVGYLLAARVSVARAARATLDTLAELLDLSPARRAELRDQMGRYRRHRLHLAGLAGALFGFLAPLVVYQGTMPNPFTVSAWTPEFAVRRALAPVVGWAFGTYLLATFRESTRVSNLSRHLCALDLFDSEALKPFSRFGLQVALGAAGLVSLVALLITERGFGHLVLILVGIAGAAGAAALVLPLRGLRDRIAEEKRRELACCREALRRARDAMVEGRSIVTEHGRISEVVAYRNLVESIDEWPIDTPTIVRACGYLGLPVISWFSGSVAPATVLGMIKLLVQ